MNKNLSFLLCLWLSGCMMGGMSQQESQIKAEINELTQQKSITAALTAYEKFGQAQYTERSQFLQCEIGDTFDYKKNLFKSDIKIECICADYDGAKYFSDECISYRKQLDFSPIAFFDYKRFLSDEDITLIPTEYHFRNIFAMWQIRSSICDEYVWKLKRKCLDTHTSTYDQKCLKTDAEKNYKKRCPDIENWILDMREVIQNNADTFDYAAKHCDLIDFVPLITIDTMEVYSNFEDRCVQIASTFPFLTNEKQPTNK